MTSRSKRQLKELRRLVQERSEREALDRPCPECGEIPARMIWVDQATGLDPTTGKPPCPECRRRQDRYRPDAYNVVEFYPVDPDLDPDGDQNSPQAV